MTRVIFFVIIALLVSVVGSRLLRKAGGFRGLLGMLADFTGIGAKPAAIRAKPRKSDMVDLDERMRARSSRMREIMELDEAEAARQVAAVLALIDSWHLGACMTEPIRTFIPIHLSVRQMLEQYSSLESPRGSARLDVTLLAQFYWPGRDILEFGADASAAPEKFWQIGRDSDGSPVVVKSLEPTVYVVHKGAGSSSPAWSSSYPTIHHWVLAKHADSELGS